MVHVYNQAQLAAALYCQEPSIQIAGDFSLISQLSILYDVTIESLTPGSPHTIFKDPGYDGFLFRIFGGAPSALQTSPSTDGLRTMIPILHWPVLSSV